MNVSQLWCVLRSSGASTLRLAASLDAAGFVVWTPVQTLSRRVPRSKERRDVAAPMMPTFVFARADRINDLLALSKADVKDHPGFSVFRHYDRIPLISDASLEPLRTAENRAAAPKQRRVFRQGEGVRVPSGSFAGMSGKVEETKGQFTLVCFPGWSLPVKIDTFLLRHDTAINAQAA